MRSTREEAEREVFGPVSEGPAPSEATTESVEFARLNTPVVVEAYRALSALYLEAPAAVAKDVNTKVVAAFHELALRGRAAVGDPAPPPQGMIAKARQNRAAMPGILRDVLEACCGDCWTDTEEVARRVTLDLDVWPRELADPVLPGRDTPTGGNTK